MKIIIVSGVADQREVQQLMSAGADAFVKKPFSIDELLSRIGELLGV
jgi:DNA-binding response OmpR family regulator